MYQRASPTTAWATLPRYCQFSPDRAGDLFDSEEAQWRATEDESGKIRRKRWSRPLLFYVLRIALAVVFRRQLLFLFVLLSRARRSLSFGYATVKAFIPYGNLTLENYVAVFASLTFCITSAIRPSTPSSVMASGWRRSSTARWATRWACLVTPLGAEAACSLMIALTIIPN